MRKFIINVNGKSYEVEVEEIIGGSKPAASVAPAEAPPAIQSAPVVQQAAPASQPKADDAQPNTAQPDTAQPGAAASGKVGSVQINSPMPGTILDIKVSVGDNIKKGQVVLILEAMKMENEIMAPRMERFHPSIPAKAPA